MKFEWDKKKSETNLQKHGISFDEAKTIFNGHVLTIEDKRKEYGEARKITIGELEEEPEEEPPEEDELDDELLELEVDEEAGQSAKPAQVPEFVGQHPFIQQRGPH